jgi:glycogen operon protein
VRGDEGMVDALCQRLYGSDDLFPDTLMDAYRPFQSINYVTCHDGFCLYDLVSYNARHNQANGQDGRDGHDDNRSWNCGWEGDDGVPPEVAELRRRQVKNFCCLLMLANGTPMFVAGDEFMHTQHGNNNPWNQDNDLTWLDWDGLERNRDVFRFFKEMIAFRKAHASIARSTFWREDVSWYGPRGALDRSAGSRQLAFLLRGGSQADQDLYVMANAGASDVAFDIQAGSGWRRVVDTALPSPMDICGFDRAEAAGDAYRVRGRSVVVLAAGAGQA